MCKREGVGRERERERETDRQTDRQTEIKTERIFRLGNSSMNGLRSWAGLLTCGGERVCVC